MNIDDVKKFVARGQAAQKAIDDMVISKKQLDDLRGKIASLEKENADLLALLSYSGTQLADAQRELTFWRQRQQGS